MKGIASKLLTKLGPLAGLMGTLAAAFVCLVILLGMLGAVALCIYAGVNPDRSIGGRLFCFAGAALTAYISWLMARMCLNDWGEIVRDWRKPKS